MALLGAHRLRTIDQPARPDAPSTGRLVVDQTKPLGAPSAPWAYKHRPKAAVPEGPQPDADLIFDPIFAEQDARCLCVPPNVAERDHCRHANLRQIVDRALHGAVKLTPLDTAVYFAVHSFAPPWSLKRVLARSATRVRFAKCRRATGWDRRKDAVS